MIGFCSELKFQEGAEMTPEGYIVLKDNNGQTYPKICLDKPLRIEVPNKLQHLCRLAVHKHFENQELPYLPQNVRKYLEDYPYSL